MPDGPPLHPDVAHLGFLLGSWKGKGSGGYATLDDFSYLEVATFTHVGKPFLSYVQRTVDASTGAPLHAETGYLRPAGADAAELIIAQPSGVMEVHDVRVEGSTLTAESSQVITTPTAKDVSGVRRIVTVRGNDMHYELHMAAVGQPDALHLEAVLSRD